MQGAVLLCLMLCCCIVCQHLAPQPCSASQCSWGKGCPRSALDCRPPGLGMCRLLGDDGTLLGCIEHSKACESKLRGKSGEGDMEGGRAFKYCSYSPMSAWTRTENLENCARQSLPRPRVRVTPDSGQMKLSWAGFHHIIPNSCRP